MMSVSRQLILWGATGHVKVLAELARNQGMEIVAVFDNNPVVKTPFPDVPIYIGEAGFLDWKQASSQSVVGAVAIGGWHGEARVEILGMMKLHGVKTVTFCHPTAFAADSADLGEGSQLLAHATLCAEVKLGAGCIINTGASVDHECALGQGVHVAPGAVLAGCVSVGDFSFIGAGAVVLPRVRIGRKAIIGAGAVVTRDVDDEQVVYGNPARPMLIDISGD